VPSYKTHRLEPDSRLAGDDEEEVPDELGPQITAIAQILDAIGVPRLGERGFEADDILGSLVAQHEIECDVVTGDRDLFQLVSDAGQTRVISITKGVRNLEIVDDTFLLDKYGVAGHQYADFATLRGDSSDGLPGVRGIGEKTASQLISTWGSLDGLLAAYEREDELLKPAVVKKLTDSLDMIEPASKVVQVRSDSTVTTGLRAPNSLADESGLTELVRQWGIKRQVNQLLAALGLPELDSVD
jgi:5'-3' exonuclease